MCGWAERLSRAIGAFFPKTQIQRCIVHLIRNSLKYVSNKERKLVAPDLKAIYSAPTAEAAAYECASSAKNGTSVIVRSGDVGTPPGAHRSVLRVSATGPKVIYTTNAIASLNMSLPKIIKTRAVFPSEQAALKLLYLALKNVVRGRQRAGVHHWKRGPFAVGENEIGMTSGAVMDLQDPAEEITVPATDLGNPMQQIAFPVEDLRNPALEIAFPPRDLRHPALEITFPVLDPGKPVEEFVFPALEK